ncbi:uncharacterized protein LOC121727052 [Aricia agestis]|uniref:uncharacterized protein LOC121727052 n=1 Tax=Aricia agestis TaxID=91739 RepID=UPI001C20767E|nr:uncharacterized protein LOC121727052 [Aricia agestis]
MDEGERTLGLIWHPKEDSLGFDVSFKRIPVDIINGIKTPTKREMLRVVMSIFDVYGFLSPFTIKGKILLQDTWRSNIQWDEDIPQLINNKWNEWLQILKRVETIRLPRYFENVNSLRNVRDAPNSECPPSPPAPLASPRAPARAPVCRPLSPGSRTRTADACTYVSGGYNNLELHLFCDASTKAMCAVAYWRWMSNNNIRVAFIASKCRVAPLKLTSVPRLELQAALLAARLADTIGKEHTMKPVNRYFWCDSSTVLHWIRNDARCYKAFIAHRLGEIDELTSINDWRYVPTKLNVADQATRDSCDFSVFNVDSEWFRGPNFLYSDESLWPADFLVPRVNKVDLEFVNTVHIVENNLPAVPDPLRFSSWLRLLRSTCIVFSFVDIKCKKLTGTIDGDLMSKAEQLLVKYAQLQSFPEDVHSLKNNNYVNKKSRLLTLSPFLDEQGILRAGGRIDAARDVPVSVKHPVILDGRHHVARLIVKHFHVRAAHGNHETIPPSSPHWGGAWERLIRTVKSSLKVVLNERTPREEVLLTLMAEVEQIVNGRPLTHVSVEPGSEEALTPNHFLLGSSSNLPVLGEFDNSDLFLRKQWRIAQRLADMFWSRWVKEMLPQLIPRSKWTQEETPLKVGDFVFIADPNSPRNCWLRGTVEAVMPGKDERVRVVDIRTRAGILRRSAARVARVPMG